MHPPPSWLNILIDLFSYILENNLRKFLRRTKIVQRPQPPHMKIWRIKDWRSPSSWRISVNSNLIEYMYVHNFFCLRPIEESDLLAESKIRSRIGKKYRSITQTEKQTSIRKFQNKEGLPCTTKKDFVKESTDGFRIKVIWEIVCSNATKHKKSRNKVVSCYYEFLDKLCLEQKKHPLQN